VRTLTRTVDDLAEDLHIRGYTVVRTEPDPEDMTETASALGIHLGARWIGSRILEAEGDTAWLPRHTEQLDDAEPLAYFALGCLTPADERGATCLYDGRAAARALLAEDRRFTSVRITYATRWRPTKATHPLIVMGAAGPVLRFRSKLETNSVVGLPPGLGEDEMYGVVESALAEAVVLVHQWRAGDLLVVNNRAMIHARQPFAGTRRMIRFRYDDPHYRTVTLKP
jgi:alpha-ketoglutarate-dependent taurine dioxygenase